MSSPSSNAHTTIEVRYKRRREQNTTAGPQARRLESMSIDSWPGKLLDVSDGSSRFGDQKGMRCGEVSPMPRLPPQL